MLLESIDFIGNRLLILFGLLQHNQQFLLLQLILFTVNILIFIGLEQLGLSVLVLLILTLKIPELSIQLVQSILLVLDRSMCLIQPGTGIGKLFFLMSNQIINAISSLVVIVNFYVQN